jgi:hypothetical protein
VQRSGALVGGAAAAELGRSLLGQARAREAADGPGSGPGGGLLESGCKPLPLVDTSLGIEMFGCDELVVVDQII